MRVFKEVQPLSNYKLYSSKHYQTVLEMQPKKMPFAGRNMLQRVLVGFVWCLLLPWSDVAGFWFWFIFLLTITAGVESAHSDSSRKACPPDLVFDVMAFGSIWQNTLLDNLAVCQFSRFYFRFSRCNGIWLYLQKTPLDNLVVILFYVFICMQHPRSPLPLVSTTKVVFLAWLVFQIWLVSHKKQRHQPMVFSMKKVHARYMYITMSST